MVATGSFALKPGHHCDFSAMADVLSLTGSDRGQGIGLITGKKDILVKCSDVTDIVEKFIKVAHGHEALENNRARENARENIRKKLAMEAGKEKSDSCDLQICFMNEFASDDELSDSKEDTEPAGMSTEEITAGNISKRVSQIIVPLTPVVKQDTHRSDETPNLQPEDINYSFHSEVARLQRHAREGLVKARGKARVDIQDRINTRHQTNQKLFSLVGLPQFSKLNRRTISRLNVAQLQLIQNDYLAQIEGLNEELVSLLVARDDLVMEQDAMLTDIEDLSEFVNIKN